MLSIVRPNVTSITPLARRDAPPCTSPFRATDGMHAASDRCRGQAGRQGHFRQLACHYAADDGYCQILDVLIPSPEVNVNSQDITSKTPLMKAVRNNKTDSCASFTQSQRRPEHYRQKLTTGVGAPSWRPSATTQGGGAAPPERQLRVNRREFKTGDTALHIAIKRNYTRVVELLLAAGSRHDVYNHQGETAIHDAVAGNKMDITWLLLVYNIDLDVPVKYFPNGVYKSVFKLAAERGHYKMCRLLATIGYVDYSARMYFYAGYVQARPGAGRRPCCADV
ncbi:hypothetical protein Btru_011352 [Bulinus truncatus]|nr:hypothetical protein Btru_011352 [Bulinus truncatus]